MTALLAILCFTLIAIIVVQIGKVTELASKIRGEEEMQYTANRRHAYGMLLFVILFLVGSVISAWAMKNYFLGYGPHQAASSHGVKLDRMFDVTLFFTGLVFVITQIALFYFAYRYHGRRGRKAEYIVHDTKLEIVWTVIPAVVMAYLVISGLNVWNEVMADVGPNDDYLEIEATGYQFAWSIRYPGADGKLGEKNFRMVTATNPLGQNWKDKKNLDDLHADEIVLPVGKKIRVRITARDVLHNFYLPHFRVKMDAIPGMPTYFVFTPEKTTEEYRQELSRYPEYQRPLDPNDPNSEMLWEAFNFELACAELCGTGHWSMRRLVKIVSEEEYQDWLAMQKPYYLTSIRGSDVDPYTDEWFDFEIRERREAFNEKLESILGDEERENIFVFDYVNFGSGSAQLTPTSRYELDFLVDALNKYPNMRIELGGHTDNTGEAESNQRLSESRARAVYNYLLNKGVAESRLNAAGYGQSRPIDSNDTEAGRVKNRRTEFKVISL
jgi:cytochrome c oxidase subunit 2